MEEERRKPEARRPEGAGSAERHAHAKLTAERLAARAGTLADRGKLDRAIADFQVAIAMDRECICAYLGLAATYRSMGMCREALEILAAAPEPVDAPEGPDGDFAFYIYNEMSAIYLAMEDRALALECARKALAAAAEAQPPPGPQATGEAESVAERPEADAAMIQDLKALVQELEVT